MPPPGPIMGGFGSALIALATSLVQNTPISVSTAGTSNIAANTTTPFIYCFQRITVAAGSYTRNFTLDAANAVQNAIMELDFAIAAGTDATLILPIYSLSTGGTLIEQLRGRAEASYYNLRVRFNGTNWEKLTLSSQ